MAKTVLIVEDERAIVEILKFNLKREGYETLEALDLLVRQGKVRYVGASSGEAFRLAKALATADLRGYPRFVSMQNHYNLLYREEEREMLPLCAAEGVGVVEDDDGGGGGRQVWAEADAGRAAAAGVADGAAGRSGGLVVVGRE